MLQSKSRLLELNAKLAENLTRKGVTATADETTTTLVNKVADITSGDSVLRGLIQRDVTEFVIPDGVTRIGDYAFFGFSNLTSITIPDSVTSIGNGGFHKCTSLTSITIPDSVTSIGGWAFQDCSSLKSITIPDGVTSIGDVGFYRCTSLTSITIPDSVTSIGNDVFQYCTAIKDVILGDGFNANNLNLSASKLIERETAVNMFIALADRTGQTAYKLTIGATNLAKLTEEDILIATNKNWTLA